jgi:GAF domain-containing protein
MPLAERPAPGPPSAPRPLAPPHPHALRSPLAPFTARLRDLLATVEASALLGAVETRVRGLGEHLRFACLAIPCSEALVAIEIEALGRLTVPVVADASGHRASGAAFPPSGTPFAYLLGGGGGHAVELSAADPMLAPLAPLLAAPPRAAVFVPLRVGAATVGGAALFSHERPLGGRELDMAERLAEVLALTVESFRTERVVFELFARALPDLLAGGSGAPEGAGDERRGAVEASAPPTSLRAALERHIHALRLTPEYRRRLELAAVVGRLADRGEAEARLAVDLLARLDVYACGGAEPAPPSDGGAA